MSFRRGAREWLRLWAPSPEDASILVRIHLAFFAVLLMILLIEIDLGGSTRVSPDGGTQISEGEPRRLMVLIVDSLGVDDVEDLPALDRIRRFGFTAEIEPCPERNSYSCVREALTGRSGFSFFGTLLDWEAGGTAGTNLLRDYRERGASVAMLSDGQLALFGRDVDTDESVEGLEPEQEAQRALSLMRSHDLVVYHYTWHERQTQSEFRGGGDYQNSLAVLNRTLRLIERGLPDDMDLVVFGDHGHDELGRHVPGLDVPTLFVARSSHLIPGEVGARLPMTAIRYLFGLMSGVHTDRMEWDPSWSTWSSDGLSSSVERLLSSEPNPPSSTFPITTVIFSGVLVSMAAWMVGSGFTAIAMFAGLVGGLSFGAWYPSWNDGQAEMGLAGLLWLIPLLVVLVAAFWKRRLWSVWMGAAGWGLAALVVYPPMFESIGLLQNIGKIGLPVVVISAIAYEKELLRRPREPGYRRQMGWNMVCVFTAILGFEMLSDFAIENWEIVSFPVVGEVFGRRITSALVLAGLGFLIHWWVERDTRRRHSVFWALASGLGLSGIVVLPSIVYVIPLLVSFNGLLLRDVWRSRSICLGLFWGLPYLYSDVLCIGMLVVVVATVGSLSILNHARRSIPAELEQWIPWVGGLVLVVGSYLTLAWSHGFGLSRMSVGFFVEWLPEGVRWQDSIWWPVLVAYLIKLSIPIILIVESCRSLMPEMFRDWVVHGARLGWLRSVWVFVFVTAWIVDAGAGVMGLRLAHFVQDGLAWVGVSTALLVFALANREVRTGKGNGDSSAVG